jgi:hypothetical protein
MRHFLLALMLAVPALAQQPSPQQPSPSIVAQREALTKLAFLIGKWSGPVTVARGPGEPLHLTQTEDVQLKLDGLLILIEGNSRAEDGQNAFRALATITYDDAAHLYHFRAYHDGRYVDTELAVPTNGFTWSLDDRGRRRQQSSSQERRHAFEAPALIDHRADTLPHYC